LRIGRRRAPGADGLHAVFVDRQRVEVLQLEAVAAGMDRVRPGLTQVGLAGRRRRQSLSVLHLVAFGAGYGGPDQIGRGGGGLRSVEAGWRHALRTGGGFPIPAGRASREGVPREAAAGAIAAQPEFVFGARIETVDRRRRAGDHQRRRPVEIGGPPPLELVPLGAGHGIPLQGHAVRSPVGDLEMSRNRTAEGTTVALDGGPGGFEAGGADRAVGAGLDRHHGTGRGDAGGRRERHRLRARAPGVLARPCAQQPAGGAGAVVDAQPVAIRH